MEGRPQGERELVARARRGDRGAFDALVRPHQEAAFRLAYVITGDPADAEDASQEALLKAWRALGRFRAAQPLRPWFLRIVANEARNRRRATGRRARLPARVAAEISGGAAPSPEDTVTAADERRRVLALLDELPEPARLVLACRYLLDLSEDETAAALGVRRGTVKSRSARALELLRQLHG